MLDFPQYYKLDTIIFPVMKDTVEYYIIEFYAATTTIDRINAILHICYAVIQQKSFIELMHTELFILEMLKCIVRNEEWLQTYLPLFYEDMMKSLKKYQFTEGTYDHELAKFFENIYVNIEDVQSVYSKRNLPHNAI
jgi:hypothetical protein